MYNYNNYKNFFTFYKKIYNYIKKISSPHNYKFFFSGKNKNGPKQYYVIQK